MLKNIFLFTFFVLGFVNVFSQNNVIPKNDILSLERRITNLIKQKKHDAYKGGFKMYHVYNVSPSEKLDSFEFKNNIFWDKIHPTYYSIKTPFHKRSFLRSQTIVCDSSKRIIGSADARCFTTNIDFNEDKHDKFLINLFDNQKFEFVYYMYGTPLSVYFAVKGSTVVVFMKSQDGYKILTLEEFVNSCNHCFIFKTARRVL